MYYIKVTYYYYQGTLHAPKDGALVEDKKLVFDTKESAISYLEKMGVDLHLKGSIFTHSYYELNHGEYEAPDYQVRKLRGANQ
mgnify:CR=1 FL=1